MDVDAQLFQRLCQTLINNSLFFIEFNKKSNTVDDVLSNVDNQDIIKSVQLEVLELCKKFPLYSEMSYEMS